MYYIFVENGKINGSGECECLTEGIQNIEVTEEVYNNFIEDTDFYIYKDGEIIPNPDYEEIKKRKHRQELDALNMTKADFWIALLDRDITKDQVKAMIGQIPDETLKQKTLIRLDEADHFWRGDPSIDVIGQMFGVTSEDLDYLFENGSLPENS